MHFPSSFQQHSGYTRCYYHFALSSQQSWVYIFQTSLWCSVFIRVERWEWNSSHIPLTITRFVQGLLVVFQLKMLPTCCLTYWYGAAANLQLLQLLSNPASPFLSPMSSTYLASLWVPASLAANLHIKVGDLEVLVRHQHEFHYIL